MQLESICRAAATAFAVLILAGPASAMGINISDAPDSRPSGLVLRHNNAMEFSRRMSPTSDYVLVKRRVGTGWVEQRGNAAEALERAFEGREMPAPLSQQQASSAPKLDHPVHPVHPGQGHGMGYDKPVAGVPEPSAALLMALGMTVTGAHLRGRARR